ncbi:hypothetical protein D3C76_1124380 [compost metagenome]
MAGAIVGEIAIGQGGGRVGVTFCGARRCAFADQFAGEGACAVEQAVAFPEQAVDQAELKGTARADRLAGHHHLQCRFGPDQSRQTLRPARTGQQAQVDFRQAEAAVGSTDAITAGQCQFQPATEGEAADAGNQRLVDLGQAQQQVGQGWGGERPGESEFADVGAGAEQAVCTVHDDRRDGRIAGGALTGVENGRTQGLPQCVDRL